MPREVRVTIAMGANGKRKPRRPRIEIVSGGASESEAAAIVAALEQFLAEAAPAPMPPAPSAWQRAALEDGVLARHRLTNPTERSRQWP
jgi:hypothetical protein